MRRIASATFEHQFFANCDRLGIEVTGHRLQDRIGLREESGIFWGNVFVLWAQFPSPNRLFRQKAPNSHRLGYTYSEVVIRATPVAPKMIDMS